MTAFVFRRALKGKRKKTSANDTCGKTQRHQQSPDMKSADLLARNFGRRAVIFEELEVIELLRAAVVREGSQTHFARRHGIDRVQVNRLLKGRKMNVTAAIAKALGLRMVFAAE